jgi:hypothetical protein
MLTYADVCERMWMYADTPVEKALGPASAGSGHEQGRGGQEMMLIHHTRNTQVIEP